MKTLAALILGVSLLSACSPSPSSDDILLSHAQARGGIAAIAAKSMSTEEITNEDLAEMIQVNIVEKMATKEQVEQLRNEVREIKDVVLADHQARIERLEQAFQAAHPHR